MIFKAFSKPLDNEESLKKYFKYIKNSPTFDYFLLQLFCI